MVSIAINANCMDVMQQYPDKYFDLAVVDPPYGSGGGEFVGETRFGGRFDRYLQDCPDGRKVGGKIRKKNRKLGLCPRRGLFPGTFSRV